MGLFSLEGFSRRLNRLFHPALSVGLPAFLTVGARMFSGLMLSQCTADMLIVEQRLPSAPACVQSIPAAAQALDSPDFACGAVTHAARTAVRRVVAHLGEDRPLYPDHNAMTATVARCDVLDAVETTVGPLAR